ncbi:IclR family transcriptional regulator [Bradyrhizobium erythrophlei]|jgi:IclR family pca regulon transcriptional regulator|uniref:Transcriptional regulator, IclR family n=1 Tax=Bradyrhizobium erythrophlei TaxID=1437360 RepID=A0A1M5MBR4_9BRAD|nr:IclR family transcriptional regulator C-terminal domain-containing protein [Bradyrhizobium erythrophlei]SHG74740.1 transcriptional regulator, IclR family [Bradyrhizobium erythrophlei]
MIRSRPGRPRAESRSAAPCGSDNADSGLYVASVEKAFRVLEALNRAGRPVGLSGLAPLTGFGRSATQRFLFTLRALGYVNQDATTKSYSLAPKMLEFGRAYLSADFIRDQARPFLDAANRESGEMVNLTVLDREDVVYVLRFPSRHVVCVNLAVGSRLPAYCTAPGRAILANLEEDEAKAILEKSLREKKTPHTVTGMAALLRILADVRKRGLCINNQEAFVGDLSIAAPVFGHDGRVLGAVNIAVPTARWTITQAKREFVPIITKAAQQITKALAKQAATASRI